MHHGHNCIRFIPQAGFVAQGSDQRHNVKMKLMETFLTINFTSSQPVQPASAVDDEERAITALHGEDQRTSTRVLDEEEGGGGSEIVHIDETEREQNISPGVNQGAAVVATTTPPPLTIAHNSGSQQEQTTNPTTTVQRQNCRVDRKKPALQLLVNLRLVGMWACWGVFAVFFAATAAPPCRFFWLVTVRIVLFLPHAIAFGVFGKSRDDRGEFTSSFLFLHVSVFVDSARSHWLAHTHTHKSSLTLVCSVLLCCQLGLSILVVLIGIALFVRDDSDERFCARGTRAFYYGTLPLVVCEITFNLLIFTTILLIWCERHANLEFGELIALLLPEGISKLVRQNQRTGTTKASVCAKQKQSSHVCHPSFCRCQGRKKEESVRSGKTRQGV